MTLRRRQDENNFFAPDKHKERISNSLRVLSFQGFVTLRDFRSKKRTQPLSQNHLRACPGLAKKFFFMLEPTQKKNADDWKHTQQKSPAQGRAFLNDFYME